MLPGQFFSELRRRRVWRVAGAYVLVVWMAVEIVLETFPVLGVPGWISRAVVILAFVGFPVTVILAWVFDITPEGVVRTPADDAPAGEPGTAAQPPRVVVTRAPARMAGVFGAGILVALVGFGAYSVFAPSVLVRPESIQSVAVLPFADLSPGQDQAYFADGVTEELINRLARLQEIRVAARTSSFMFRDRDADLDEIARRLGVDAVVEGSIRRDGSRLRVTVELVDVASGFQIWAEKYDRTADDIFDIQDDISTAIVEALRVQLLPAASRLRAGTGSVRAHDAYLLGLARWHARTPDDLLRALDYFQEAVEEDDSYAPAYAGLALTYAVLPSYTDTPADVAAEKGSRAAARALALNAQQAEAHAAIGQIAQGLEWNLDAAETAYRRAIEFQPNYATGHQWYAETLTMMGRLGEARQEIDRARALDPLSVAARNTAAFLATVERDYEGARRAYHDMLADNPGYTLGQLNLLFLCLAAACPEDAADAARAAFPAAAVPAVLSVIRATSDRAERPAARTALTTLDGHHPPALLALLHAAIGDDEGALDRLEQAYAEGADPNVPFYLVHPLFDSLRRSPRFRAIATAIGIEAPSAVLPR